MRGIFWLILMRLQEGASILCTASHTPLLFDFLCRMINLMKLFYSNTKPGEQNRTYYATRLD